MAACSAVSYGGEGRSSSGIVIYVQTMSMGVKRTVLAAC